MTSMIMADGTMGQMMEPVQLDFDIKPAPEKPWATTGTKMSRPHNIVNSLSLVPEGLSSSISPAMSVIKRWKKRFPCLRNISWTTPRYALLPSALPPEFPKRR